jgi:hypothetical protein
MPSSPTLPAKSSPSHTDEVVLNDDTVLTIRGLFALGAEIVTESTTARDMLPADAGKVVRFTATGAKTATFDDGDSFTAGQVFHVTNRAASDSLTLTAAGGMTLNSPAGGTLVLEPGMTVTVMIVASDEADVLGQTVAA